MSYINWKIKGPKLASCNCAYDGLVFGARYRWPGPVHQGNGVVQGVIDERATTAQREALFTILSGKEQSRPPPSTSTAPPSPRNTTRSSPGSSSTATSRRAAGASWFPA
jgi:hypothetical protein